MRIVAFALMIVLLAVFIIPGAVAADCCQYEIGSCCWRLCCAEVTYTYRVSYHERVESGYYTNWGTPMYHSVLRHEYVEAHNSREAAAMLGKRAGYSAFVSRVLPGS